jgi:hypothetical protein
LDVRHEDFVASPQSELTRICSFLELTATEDYLEACAAIVFKEPRQSRFSIDWTPEQLRQIQARMQSYSFLTGYTFQD